MRNFLLFSGQLANTCTLPKLKILVEICIGREDRRFIDFKEEIK
jgi:hypothetical protein